MLEPKKMEELELLRRKLKRRNVVLDEVRKAYLRDVVAVKQRELLKQIAEEKAGIVHEDPKVALQRDKELVQEGLEVARSTGLDLRPTLQLYAPSECTFRVAHGGSLDEYGGYVEIIHRESRKVNELRNKVEELIELEQSMRLKATELEISQQKDRLALADQREVNQEQREILSHEIEALKNHIQKLEDTTVALGQAKNQNSKLRLELEASKQKLQDFDICQAQCKDLKEKDNNARFILKGRDRRIRELENEGSQLRSAAEEDMRRYSALEAQFMNERNEKDAVLLKMAALQDQLNAEIETSRNIQKTLDKSRLNERDLKQQLVDMQNEHRELNEDNEREQEALREQADELRQRMRTAEAELDTTQSNFEQERASHTNAILELKNKLETEHNEMIQRLKTELETSRDTTQQLIEAPSEDAPLNEHNVEKLEATLNIFKDIGIEIRKKKKATATTAERIQNVQDVAKLVVTQYRDLEDHKKELEKHLIAFQSHASTGTRATAKVEALLAENPSKTLLVKALRSNARDAQQLRLELNLMLSEKKRADSQIARLKQRLEERDSDEDDAERIAYQMRTASSEKNSGQVPYDFKKKIELLQQSLAIAKRSSQEYRTKFEDSENALDEARITIEDLQDQLYAMEEKGANRLTQAAALLLKIHADARSLALGRFKYKPDATASTCDEYAKANQIEITGGSDDTKVLDVIIQDEVAPNHIFGLFRHRIALELSKAGVRMEAAGLQSGLRPSSRDRSSLEKKESKSEEKKSEGDEEKENPQDDDTHEKPVDEETTITCETEQNYSVADQEFRIAQLKDEIKVVKGLLSEALEYKQLCADLQSRCSQQSSRLDDMSKAALEAAKQQESILKQLRECQAELAAEIQAKRDLQLKYDDANENIADLQNDLREAIEKYENLIRRDRERLETNVDIGLQYHQPGIDTGIQTTFKTPGMTLRRINSIHKIPHPSRSAGAGVVTPAFVSDEPPYSLKAERFQRHFKLGSCCDLYHKSGGNSHDSCCSKNVSNNANTNRLLPTLQSPANESASSTQPQSNSDYHHRPSL